MNVHRETYGGLEIWCRSIGADVRSTMWEWGTGLCQQAGHKEFRDGKVWFGLKGKVQCLHAMIMFYNDGKSGHGKHEAMWLGSSKQQPAGGTSYMGAGPYSPMNGSGSSISVSWFWGSVVDGPAKERPAPFGLLGSTSSCPEAGPLLLLSLGAGVSIQYKPQ
ncbi:hypothetical protein SERLA73DRAFT_157500 [Serpula lacrymans var. lacrymans S7.3]|uniref:Uncharacterized protein n=1 Tax=Serpula lacrymans var. lacrymans (strain S7.3) TaxID=936435 RepID=F8QJB7_SERL3|nr:hypothetical protein SERLA73DRAFT_157500 [Serpula lacrymans var. lacrymans S7.3]